jgi:hypothetical protein
VQAKKEWKPYYLQEALLKDKILEEMYYELMSQSSEDKAPNILKMILLLSKHSLKSKKPHW